MTDLASLRYEIDSSDAMKARRDLDLMNDAAERAEFGAGKLNKAASAGGGLGKLSHAAMDAAKSLRDGVAASLGRVGAALASFGGPVGVVISLLALLGAAAGGLLVKWALVSDRMDSLRNQFSALNQSVTLGVRDFERLRQLSGQLPETMDELTKAYIALKTQGINPTNETLRAFGALAFATGESIEGVSNAIGAAVNGQFQSLQKFGVSMKKDGASIKATFHGVTTSIGQDSDSIREYMENIGNTNFSIGYKEEAETVASATERMGESFDRLYDYIGEKSGLKETLKNAADWVTNFINAWIPGAASIDATREAVMRAKKDLSSLPTAGEGWRDAAKRTYNERQANAVVVAEQRHLENFAQDKTRPAEAMYTNIQLKEAQYATMKGQFLNTPSTEWDSVPYQTLQQDMSTLRAEIAAAKQEYEDFSLTIHDEDRPSVSKPPPMSKDDEKRATAIGNIKEAMELERKELEKLLAAELMGIENKDDIIAQYKVEEVLRKNKIDATSEEGKAILAQAQANRELEQSRDTAAHQRELDDLVKAQKRLLAAEKEGEHQAMLMAARIQEENVQLALGNDLRDASVQLQIDEALALAELGYQIDVVKDKRIADAKALADWSREQEKLLDHVAENIFDSWTNMFRELLDGGKDAFKNFGDSLVNIFKDVIAQMAVLAIARPIIVPMIGTIGGMMGLSQQTIAGVTNNFGGGGGGGGALGNVANVASIGKNLSGMGSSLFTGAGSVARNFAFGAQVTGANIAANGFTGSMGTNLGSAWANATSGNFSMALGQAAPYLPILGGALYGYQQHGVQGAVTGGLGAWGGAELGALIAGPIGAIVGGILGGLLGGSIGPEPSNKSGTATVDLMSGETEIGGMTGKKFSQANRDSAAELAKGAKEIADLLKNTLGGQFTQKVSIEVGSRDGIVVGVGNQPRVNYGYNTEALVAGLIEQIVDSMTGVSEEVKTALANVDFSNLEQAVIDLQFIADYTSGDMFKVESINAAQAALDQLNATFDAVATEAERLGLSTARAETERTNAIDELNSGFLEGITDQINAIVDPIGEALKQQERIAQDRLDQARTLGVDLVEVERLNMLEREQIIKQVYQGINDFLDGLQLSSLSTLTPTERLSSAETDFNSAALSALTGDLDAIKALPGIAQAFLQEGASFYAGTEKYQDIFDHVTGTLSDIAASDPVDIEPAVEAIDNMAAQSVLNTIDIVAAVDALKEETTALNKVQAFMLTIMKTFLASAAA